MNGSTVTRKTLYLNADSVQVRVDGDALRVRQAQKSESLIPLRRVDRAIVQDSQNDLLQSCLAIVRHGGTVHIQDAAGNLCALLQQPWMEGTHEYLRLAQLIEHSVGLAPYRRWLDNQRRHAWSLVFRRNYCGDFEANRKRLVRYLLYFQPGADTSAEIDWLEQQLWAWLQARLDRDGLHPIVRALDNRAENLMQALIPCLLLPLMWAYVRWRRCNATVLAGNRTTFFELQARTLLKAQFQRHIGALMEEYHSHLSANKTKFGNHCLPGNTTP